MQFIVYFCGVRIIKKSTLKEFAEQYPAAKEPLDEWYNKTKKATWENFSDLKKAFNSTDYVGNNRYIFDIGGNKFRLIALIIFKAKMIFILWFGTHADYDKLNKSTGAKNVIFKP